MKLRDIARRIGRSLDAWQPELLPRIDQLDVITPRIIPADLPPAPYEPRKTVMAGPLPRRYSRQDRALDQAAHRRLLAALYFDEDFADEARAEVTTPNGGSK
jgi:hypothetical protein